MYRLDGCDILIATFRLMGVGMWSMIGRGIDVKGRWNLWWGYRWFWIALAAILVVGLFS